MMYRIALLVLWVTLKVVGAASDNVVQLQDVASQVLESSSIWAVFASSNKLSPVMDVVASLMKGIHSVGVWDDDTSNVPDSWRGSSDTVLFFLGDDKQEPWRRVAFKNDARSFYEEVLTTMAMAMDSTVGSRGQELSGKIPKEKATRKPKKKKSAFVKVDESNFEALVLNNPAVVALALTAPWCGHCQRLLPEWKEAAQMLGGEDVVMGWVDATVETKIAAQYQVQGYPTIKIFPGGSNSSPYDYPGERSAAGMTEFLLQEVERSGVPRPVPELVEPDQLDDACSGSNHLCVIAALPHILDSGATGRQNYLQSLSKVARTFRKNFSFLWFEGGGAQSELENTLGLTFGFPALVAISLDREALAVMHGAFRDTNIQTFLHGITTGRQSVVPLSVPGSELPVATTEPWDGQDGKPLEEDDDFDLEAFLNDEL